MIHTQKTLLIEKEEPKVYPENETLEVEKIIEKVEKISPEVDIEKEKVETLNPVPAAHQNTNEVNMIQFSKLWIDLFESIFKNIPTIYFPLKEYVPTIKNNNIEIHLKNELQKEHFEPKVREILAFFRSQFIEELEDVIIHVDETFTPRKVIYDTSDKMKNLSEQNPNFEDFTSILELRVKE